VAEERQTLGFSKAVRKHWKSSEQAFGWWRRQIEKLGVFCFQLDLDPRDIRGASIWLAGRYPFILVNHHDAESATGRLFTLLHEYGHLLLSRGSDGIACDFRGRRDGHGGEPFANRFAARMLVMHDEFQQRLRESNKCRHKENWSDAELDELRKPLFVSRDVVAVSLQELGLAPQGFYQRKQEEWESRYAKRQGWGRAKPLKKWQRKARDLGESALRTFVTLHDKAALPVLDSAYVLDTKVEKIPQFMDGFRRILSQQ
jgi:Zn-dependent peptidase ImmA (M78 family)